MRASSNKVNEAYEIRVHEDQDQYGDPWIWGCLAVPVNDHCVEIRLVQKVPSREEARSAFQVLLDLGFTHAIWYKDDGRKLGPFKLRGEKCLE